MVLNSYQGYLGHVICVTLATCGKYVVCTACPHKHAHDPARVWMHMLLLPCLWKGVNAAFAISGAQEIHTVFV